MSPQFLTNSQNFILERFQWNWFARLLDQFPQAGDSHPVMAMNQFTLKYFNWIISQNALNM